MTPDPRQLRELHRCPKNVIDGNLRMVTQAQLDFYYAAHDALPVLLDAYEELEGNESLRAALAHLGRCKIVAAELRERAERAERERDRLLAVLRDTDEWLAEQGLRSERVEASLIRSDSKRDVEPPIGECLICGHRMRLGVWRERFPQFGVCGPCRDAAVSLRGPCSAERGCFCGSPP